MTASDSSIADSPDWLGYLTYVDLPSLGTVGGLLIVDRRARPIEFHCSAPILPTRTQAILYGQTLRSALLCDQIGKSLVEQLEQLPRLLLTNEPMALGLRELVNVPIALFGSETETTMASVSSFQEVESASRTDHGLLEFGGYPFTASSLALSDRDVICDVLSEVPGRWDLKEPIERICEAVREAHRAAA